MKNVILEEIISQLRQVDYLLNSDWDTELQNFVEFPDELWTMTDNLSEEVLGIISQVGEIQKAYDDARDRLPYRDMY